MKALATIVITSALSLGGYNLWERPATAPQAPVLSPVTPAVPAAPAAEPAVLTQEEAKPIIETTTPPLAESIVFESTELLTAVQQGIVQPVLRGNARDRIFAQFRNNSPTPIRLTVPAGQVFESGRNVVVALRRTEVELMPAQTVDAMLSTAALHSTNKVGTVLFKPSYQDAEKVAAFIQWLSAHPEVSAPAAQTAILAIMENLPLAAFARFAPANGSTVKYDTDAFRVETGDIIGALSALRASGASLSGLMLAADPQLQIEAMIEPLSREAAKRFYGISEADEWEYWKRELLQGNPGTRHYALFGIARFYPEVALEMLPKWVRESKTHPVYRMAAVQALADTQRADALPLLRQLIDELGADTDLGKAAVQAMMFLDQRLTQLASLQTTVAFRGTAGISSDSQF